MTFHAQNHRVLAAGSGADRGSDLAASASDALQRAEAEIREVIEGRRLAWNAQDVAGYSQLLAVDAELTSATGKSAHGRDEILRLYADQRQGIYRDAAISSTVVERIKFVTTEVAVADATFVMTGVRTSTGALPSVEGVNSYLLVCRSGSWVIWSMRSVPKIAIGP